MEAKMQNYILQIMQEGKKGLYLCEMPTGSGKTYAVSRAIAAYSRTQSKEKRKIIYVTTLKKNLPEEELRASFSDDVEYNKSVLRVRSNFDEVTEKIESTNIPNQFKTNTYYALCKLVNLYKHAIDRTNQDIDYVNDLKDRINNQENLFRREIVAKLKASFENKKIRLEAIRKNRDWQWIGELYPAVYTDDHQILMMSLNKLLAYNSTLIEPSYEFLRSSLVENAIIIFDEFDSCKNVIQSVLIQKALDCTEEYLSLFVQIQKGLIPESFSKTMRQAYQHIDDLRQYTYRSIATEAQEIESKYKLYLSYKTVIEAVNHNQNFLLKDATYHSVLGHNKKYIRAAVNEDENRVDIFFESREDFYANRGKAQESVISVFALLRDVSRFLSHFRVFLLAWAEEYRQDINSNRISIEDEMTIDNAISSILDKFDVSEAGKKIIFEKIPRDSGRTRGRSLLPDNSFYQQGLELFEFEDSDSHYDSTFLRLIALYNTAEKTLVSLAERATVIGISATAEYLTPIGNFDLSYLQNKLKKSFSFTAEEFKNIKRKEFSKLWAAYKEGKVNIHAEIIKDQSVVYEIEEICETIFEDPELAMICATKIQSISNNPYYGNRYCNIVRAMHLFFQQSIQSMLYFGMALPKKNNPEWDEDLLIELFDLVILDCQKTQIVNPYGKTGLAILRSADFDIQKAKLIQRLGKGEKIFIVSSYQTLGAGQNLQYPAWDKENLVELVPADDVSDKRHHYKDIDAIYLADITNIVINTYSTTRITMEQLIQMLIHIEELNMCDDLSVQEAAEMIQVAFRSYLGQGQFRKNLLYDTSGVKNFATKIVSQAVGRTCRTFIKSKNIYIFIEEKLLDKISEGELCKHILPPEMESILKMKESLGKTYSQDEDTILRKAENISSRGMWTIRQILSQNWTKDSMIIWQVLREILLCHPTASSQLYDKSDIVHDLYITSGKPNNRYLYSQYSDYSFVTIDFGDDPIAFKNSGRAKIQSDNQQVRVYQMSEEESGLPIMLQYPGLEEFFKSKGYATHYQRNMYMMSPVLYNNIYKGALGEVVGKFIIEKELGARLNDITDPEKFEFFDFEMAPGIYVDFKSWKYSYVVDRESIKKDIYNKLDAIGGKRAYIINIIGKPELYTATQTIDARIIEIPCLIDNKGKIIRKNLQMIREEDYIYDND